MPAPMTATPREFSDTTDPGLGGGLVEREVGWGRHMSVVRALVLLDLGLELGHRLAAGHQVGDLLAGALALAEVVSDHSADEDGEVVPNGHRVRDVVRDEDDGDALLPRLHDDAEHVRGLLDS